MERYVISLVKIDNFIATCLTDGYDKRFGIVYVDYKQSSLPRYQKDSAKWYSTLIKDYK